jgi:NADH dehydrogenase
MKVFLTGASGFVGSHMLARLRAGGHQVRALVRDPARARHLADKVELVPGDVVSNAGLEQGMESCDAVIHLVGIIMESRSATFEKVHHIGTRNVLAAAQTRGISRFVHMSALGARADGVSGYQTSKWRAEEAVRASGMPHVILRPSIIFGPGDGFVTQMVQVMRAAPLFRPVVGHGRYLFRPIHIDNVVDCFVESLTNHNALGRSIDLVGPEELTLDQMLDTIAACVGVRKPAVHIPFPLMYANAALLSALLPRPPVTTEQLRMLQEGSTADPAPMLQTFHTKLITFREGLRGYLRPES